MQYLSLLANSSFWYGVIRSTTPILFAALASLISSTSGITNMALEGIMLFSALFAVLGASFSGSIWIGLLTAIVISLILTLLLGFFSMKMKADEIMVAIALNLLATGGTTFILFLITGNKSTSSSLKSGVFPSVNIPLIKDIPFIGDILSGHNLLVYLAIIAVFVMYWIIFKTPLGLRIRSIGGNEEAAESVGISVKKTRYIALTISGILTGFAGAFMSMGYLSIFTANMTAGRGYIALAAQNVGGASPFGTLLASALFGIFDQLGNQLQTMSSIPQEFVFMIPYLATVILYTIFTYRRHTKVQRNRQKVAKQAKSEATTQN